MVKFGMRVRTWDCLPQAKFCKNHLRGYTPSGQIYTKGRFLVVLVHHASFAAFCEFGLYKWHYYYYYY